MKYLIITVSLLFVSVSHSQETKIHVFDVGPGLCTLTEFPNGEFFVFDTGDANLRGRVKKSECATQIKKIVGQEMIKLLIISHADFDHYGGAIVMLDDLNIATVLHTGYDRDNRAKSYRPLLTQISDGDGAGRFREINLAKLPDEYRPLFNFGEAGVQVMSGYGHNHYGLSGDSNARNAVSIAVKIMYDRKAVLITGDAKGRDRDTDKYSCEYAEAEMVDHNGIRPLKSNILIAGHHGANDTTSRCFLAKVKPEYVVYSAGSKYGHPRKLNAARVLKSGVKEENIYRTDRGDNEAPDRLEWKQADSSCKDGKGDDTVLITLEKGKKPVLEYTGANMACE